VSESEVILRNYAIMIACMSQKIIFFSEITIYFAWSRHKREIKIVGYTNGKNDYFKDE
jgi:hypothetical protein